MQLPEVDPRVWSLSSDNLFQKYETSISGLANDQVNLRHTQFGLNTIRKNNINALTILYRQFAGNPLIIILSAATIIAYLTGQHISSYYIFGMIMVSIILGFWNEYSAVKVVRELLKKITQTTVVVRNREKIEIQALELTIGDIVLLSPGSIIPADLRLIETKDLEINESVLTGESKLIYKDAGIIASAHPVISDLKNIAFMGTNVENGMGMGIVYQIGHDTQFGKIAKASVFTKPPTDFEKGLTGYGQLILKVIILLSVAIFGINALLGHKLIDSLLFALAIAVGLTPELLPVIVTISLAHGAGKLSKKHVVAKQLISIENLGNMDILCTDKTGTLTEGKIKVADFINASGKRDKQVLHLSLVCNSAIVHHKIIGNGIDVALWDYAEREHLTEHKKVIKIDEEPFDYAKKLMYTVIKQGKAALLIVKGAPEEVLKLCQDDSQKKYLPGYERLSSDGLRVVAVATKEIALKNSYSWSDLKNLNFEGYITLQDTVKQGAAQSLLKLERLNVIIKVITGDSEIVTAHIARQVGMDVTRIVTGSDIDQMTASEFTKAVGEVNIFARVDPMQKLKIIEALRAQGHTVGYLGDGINDVPSLHSADVGISVNTAVDVAKDAATIVLLRKGLDVIAEGIIEGRKTFSNTIKYILMGTSSNFGNMFSAAGASFFLPFLPMTPVQILLTNGMYDISQMSIPSDNVDPESLLKPRHWNIGFIKNYMIFFGPLSSIYDFLTFGAMIFIFHAKDSLFQTGWFVESLATEILVIFVIRTARTPFFKSKPGKWMTLASLSMVAIGVYLPLSPIANNLGFQALPPLYFLLLVVLVSTYLLLVETVKSRFLKKYYL